MGHAGEQPAGRDLGACRRRASRVRVTARRVAGATVAATLVALVACDVAIGGFRHWWADHALTSSIVSSLLVLGVAGVIVDEVVARRARRDRARTVAVQAMILYAQARRSYAAAQPDGDASGQDDAGAEIRTLASMLLTASGSLFDDAAARVFLEDVQRLGGTLFQLLARAGSPQGHAASDRLAGEMSRVHVSAAPLMARLPPEYRATTGDLEANGAGAA